MIGEAIERDSGTVDNLGTINQDSAVITEDTETGLFVVSDGGEDETTDWYRNMGITGFVLGLICVLIAIEIIAPYVGWNTIFNHLNPLF